MGTNCASPWPGMAFIPSLFHFYMAAKALTLPLPLQNMHISLEYDIFTWHLHVEIV